MRTAKVKAALRPCSKWIAVARGAWEEIILLVVIGLLLGLLGVLIALRKWPP